MAFKKIGKGLHSEVWGNGQIAIKFYKCIEAAIREISIVSLLDHPYVIKFDEVRWYRPVASAIAVAVASADLGVSIDRPPQNMVAAVSMRQLTPMREWIETQPGPADIIKFIYGLNESLHYIHSRDVFHGDIKPSNILVDNGMPVLCDFSISILLTSRFQALDSIRFAFSYRSPEMNMAQTTLSHAFAGDMWAFGCVIADIFGPSFVCITEETFPDDVYDNTAHLCRALCVTPQGSRRGRLAQLREIARSTVEMAIRNRYEFLITERFATMPDAGAAIIKIMVGAFDGNKYMRIQTSEVNEVLGIISNIDVIVQRKDLKSYETYVNVWWAKEMSYTQTPLVKYWLRYGSGPMITAVCRMYERIMANPIGLDGTSDAIFIACVQIVRIVNGNDKVRKVPPAIIKTVMPLFSQILGRASFHDLIVD